MKKWRTPRRNKITYAKRNKRYTKSLIYISFYDGVNEKKRSIN